MLGACIATALATLFVAKWFQNIGEGRMRAELARTDAALQRLHEYVQELDPSHDRERQLLEDLYADPPKMMSGLHHMDYVKERRAAGRRTLTISIWDEETL